MMQPIYISYASPDYDLAHRLVDDLQAAGYMVFVDAVSDAGTIAWAAETRRAIRTCGAVVMILAADERRRVGMRHEGILARRRQKPVFVLVRAPRSLPRYLNDATVIDFTGDYEPARDRLLAALPGAVLLLKAPVTLPRRYPRRPPRHRNRAQRRRRRVVWGVTWLAALALCIGLGIAFGVIPV